LRQLALQVVEFETNSLRNFGGELCVYREFTPNQFKADLVPEHRSTARSMSMTNRLALAVPPLLLLALLVDLPSLAQDVPRFEAFGGYSHLRFESTTLGFADYSNLNGGKIGLTFNLTPYFGVVGEIAGGWGSPLKVYDGLVGPQISYRKRKAAFFGQVLFGKAKTHVNINGPATSSGRAIAFGGGVDYPVTSRFSVRLIQAEYLNTHTFQLNQNNLQLSTGLIYQFGHVKVHKPQKMPPP
jgi:hypothetical protein